MLGRTVAELEATLSSAEWAEWLALYRLEGWGEVQADYRTGLIVSTLANVHRARGTKAFQPQDWFASLRPPPPPAAPDDAPPAFQALWDWAQTQPPIRE
jgi:hypothetical protein